MSALAVAMMEKMLEETEAKLVEACEEIIALKRQLEEQTTIAMFWRQAAEHAVVGWNALDDKYEALLDKVASARNILDELVDDREEWAPPPDVAPLVPIRERRNFDEGTTIVEEEKPITMVCGHTAADHPPTHNYLAGAAERDGETCAMGWPIGPKDKWP
jgi:hypothetical protein